MRVYFHPRTTKGSKAVQNPYTDNFLHALSAHHSILNEHDPSSIGILKTFKYLFRIDLLVLNWIEDLADKKGGYLQIVYFVFLVNFLRFRRKKILWVLHNKLSHHKSNRASKKFMFLFLLKKSDIIITHAKDGVTFGKSFSRNLNPNIHFFPHPTIPYNPQKSTKVEHDILIWGAISEYKGIDKFLAFLHDRELEKKYRILIAGKISNKDYKQKLLALCNENIQLEDDFIERDVLAKMIQEARLVLFTYSNESVLSSGALIDTLAYEGKIVGPNTGSFKDLAEEQLIEVYNEFEELPDIIDRILAEKAESSVKKLDHYFEKTSWAEFESTINRLINA